jgi:glycosyltransferase involved in cell wall biosynthesis
MRIGFYAPFKPLGHAHPSGDLVTAAGIVDFLVDQGHQVTVVCDIRARWIYWKPWRWLNILAAKKRILTALAQNPCDLWFTYHSYYKAPDVLGPDITTRLQIPYVMFQGIYATKRRRKIKTRPGFVLNRKALLASRLVFTNKQVDKANLLRLLQPARVCYLKPGLDPTAFMFDPQARSALRQEWGVGSDPVILTAAMFRPDVKTEGLCWVIRACGELYRRGIHFQLAIAGDGTQKSRLKRLAEGEIPGKVHFVGQLPRNQMNRFYSAGDIFAFPGFNESLGMVFLEAQSCGLPVVACANAGVPEAVRHEQTGLLVPLKDFDQFVASLETLLADKALREKLSQNARAYIRKEHDLAINYREMEDRLTALVKEK